MSLGFVYLLTRFLILSVYALFAVEDDHDADDLDMDETFEAQKQGK